MTSRPESQRFARLVGALAASTAARIGEVAGWRIGLSRSTSLARGFYLALTVSLVFGLVITLSGVNPIKALFYSQIGKGIIAQVPIFLLFRLASLRDILGDYLKSWQHHLWDWLTFAVMVASVALYFWGIATANTKPPSEVNIAHSSKLSCGIGE